MIDTICCVILGLINGFFAYGHLVSPEAVFEQLLGPGGSAPDHNQTNPVTNSQESHHLIAIIGGFTACISLILISLGLFQPSSNARKFALGAYAVLQYLNIQNQYRFPINAAEGPPESMMEMPIPLCLGLMGIALIGILFSKTDGQRRQIVRNKKKAGLYAKHAATKVTKGD